MEDIASSYSKIKYQTLKNGETLAYRESGTSSNVLILLHGNLSSALCYDDMASTLALSFRVIGVDLRGFGNSTYNQPINTVDDFADDLKLFIDELKIEKCSILGWSFGGGVAMAFAIKHPGNIQKLILLASVGASGVQIYKSDQEGKPTKEKFTSKESLIEGSADFKMLSTNINSKNHAFFCGTFKYVLCDFGNAPSDKKISRYTDELLMQRNLNDVGWAMNSFNYANEMKDLKKPVLIIHGENDKLINVDDAKNTANLLGEYATLKIFENSGHAPSISHPTEVLEEIKRFLINN